MELEKSMYSDEDVVLDILSDYKRTWHKQKEINAIFKKIGKKIINSPTLWEEIIKSNIYPYESFKYAPESIKANRKIVLLAMEKHFSVEDAPAFFDKDEVFWEETVKNIFRINRIDILKYAPESVKTNRSLILSLVEENPRVLGYVGPYFYTDREIMLTAWKHSKENENPEYMWPEWYNIACQMNNNPDLYAEYQYKKEQSNASNKELTREEVDSLIEEGNKYYANQEIKNAIEKI